MKKEFNKEYALHNKGCYSKETASCLSFMQNENFSINDIMNSEIPLKDKFWFLIRKCELTKIEKQEIAISVAETVLPLYEAKYPENKAPREVVNAAKSYLKGLINLDTLLQKRPYAYAADAAAAAYTAAYAAAGYADAAYADAAAAAAYAAAAYADAAAAAAYDAAYAAAAYADAAAAAAYTAAAYADAAAAYANAADAAYAATAAAYDAAYAATVVDAASVKENYQEKLKNVIIEFISKN